MKTLEQIKAYKSAVLDGRDVSRLAEFLTEKECEEMGMSLNDEYKGKHQPKPFTEDVVLSRLKEDVKFGFEKALGKRGISASCMYGVVRMWNWVLDNELAEFDDYAQYGLPLFKATALKYGFDNPIGTDSGKEQEYAT